jgi:hypothetical protein
MENRDAETIDSIIAAFYETISGPAGPRDWDRERRLFAAGAILVPTGPIPGGPSNNKIEILDLDGYIASRSPYFAANDIFEREIARQTFLFGKVAHLLSAYEVRRKPETPILWRGVNSIQLFHDGKRWWVISVVWDNERPDNAMPDWATTASG